MDYFEYARSVGYLRIREKKMLSGESISRIVESPGALEAGKAISQNSEYDFSSLSIAGDYEKIMEETLKKNYKYLYSIAPDKTVLDIILCKYDYHNLKTAVKSKYTGKSRPELYIHYTETDPALIEAALGGEAPEKLPGHMLEAAAFALSAYERGESPQSVDAALDIHMFAHMAKLADASNNGFIREYVRLATDFHNIKTMLRAKNMAKEAKFLKQALCEGGKIPKAEIFGHFDKTPAASCEAFHYRYIGKTMKAALEDYEKTGGFSALEKLLDNALTDHIKKSKFIAFGPEIFMAYTASKENEARQIRIIMSGKINNIPNGEIKERLRDNYA
jgi:V/A-type H+-transporting ATPase subunit C